MVNNRGRSRILKTTGKKLLALLLALSCVLSGCAPLTPGLLEQLQRSVSEAAGAIAGTKAEADTHADGKPWIDSELSENLSADMPTDPRQDFHLYASKNWLTSHTIPEGYSYWDHYAERGLEVKNQCIGLLKDESLLGSDAELARSLNRLVLDWDARNERGVSEILENAEKLLKAESLSDITELLLDKDNVNLFYDFYATGPTADLNDSSVYVVEVSRGSLLLSDAAEYRERSEYGDMLYTYRKTIFTYLAGRLGMDETEAGERFDEAIAYETLLAQACMTSEDQMSADYFDRINNRMSFADIGELTGAYPLAQLLKNNGFEYDGVYIVTEPDYFRQLDQVFDEAHFEGIRDKIYVRYLLGYIDMIDREAYEFENRIYNEILGAEGTIPFG